MLRGYFDASERDDGAYVVAGYLFDSFQERKFKKEWNAAFARYGGMHMTDLVALQKGFNGISRKESNELIGQAVAFSRPRIVAGVAVACWIQDIHNYSPRWISGFGHPYAICCHLAMTSLGSWAKDHNYRDGIAYLFETGDRYAGEARDIMAMASAHPIAKDAYQYRSHDFIPKSDPDAAPIEAVDCFAWEWGKYFSETVVNQQRPMRLSLAHLLIDKLPDYRLSFMTGPRFVSFLNQIRDLGLDQLQEMLATDFIAAPTGINQAIETAKPDNQGDE